MAKLIHSVDGTVIGEFVLDRESVTIGRKTQNDIQIDSQSVSSEHARIVTLANDSFLEDMRSTNGTRVNGNAINRHLLQNGDVIEIASHQFKFLSDAGGAMEKDIEKTIVLSRAQAAVLRAPPRPQGKFEKLKAWLKSLVSG